MGENGSPIKEKYKQQGISSKDYPGSELIIAKFTNTGENPLFKDAELFYKDTFWSYLRPGDDPMIVNTYPGHKWYIKAPNGGNVLEEIVIPNRPEKQEYNVGNNNNVSSQKIIDDDDDDGNDEDSKEEEDDDDYDN